MATEKIAGRKSAPPANPRRRQAAVAPGPLGMARAVALRDAIRYAQARGGDSRVRNAYMAGWDAAMAVAREHPTVPHADH